MDLHILYAVVRLADGRTFKLRLSEPLPWAHAVDAYTALHARPTPRSGWRYNRPVSDPGYLCGAATVAHFAVRAANDPNWPADGPNVHHTLRPVR